ncbi:MAG: dienelactone hydrolase [Actinobacteria bacterium]|nr:dienelactone hydrolase [Actinomycetota bacterium]
MATTIEERFRVDTGHGEVSAVWAEPDPMRAVMIVAHGAGTGMDHPLLIGFCDVLNDAHFATVRFNFPYVEAGRKSPDRAPVAVAAWKAVFESTTERGQGRRILVGGKSYGGRMASMAVAEGMRAAGLVYLGYPLHPPGKPDRLRDEHLPGIRAPMLFLQGTRDALARFDLVQELCDRLGRWAMLHPVPGGDHSFRVKGERMSPDATGRRLGSVAARFIQAAV